MGKRKSTRTSMQSKGERRNQVNGVKEVRRDRSGFDKEFNKIKAWKKGLNPWITIPNRANGPNNRPYIKVRANDLYGDPRKLISGIYGRGSSDV